MKDFQKHGFTGGMNSDDDLRTMNPEDWRTATNIRVASSDEAAGYTNAVQNIRGTTEKTDVRLPDDTPSSLPAGDNTIIGSLEDRKSDSIFYFLYNSNSNHCVLRYYLNTDVIYKLIEDSELNFSLNNLVTGAAFVKDYLYWGDNRNPYRKLNVATAGTYTLPASEYLQLGKKPPIRPLELTTVKDSGVSENNLVGRVFWFMWRLNYVDGESSVWSPESNVINPERFDFHFEDDYVTGLRYNTIEISIPQEIFFEDYGGQYGELIQSVDFAFKDEKNGSWKKFKTLTHDEVFDLYDNGNPIEFRNNEGFTIVADSEAIKINDAIPKLGQALTLTNNRLLLGNYIEGYDSNELIVSSATSDGTTTVLVTTPSILEQNFPFLTPNGRYKIGVIFFDEFRRNNGVTTSDDLNFSSDFILDWSASAERYYYRIKYLDFDLDNTIQNIPDWATHYRLCITENLKMTDYTWVEYDETLSDVFIKSVFPDTNGNPVEGTVVILSNDKELWFNITNVSPAYNYTEGDRVIWFAGQQLTQEGVVSDIPLLRTETDGSTIWAVAKWSSDRLNLLDTDDSLFPITPNFPGSPSTNEDGNDQWSSTNTNWMYRAIAGITAATEEWTVNGDYIECTCDSTNRSTVFGDERQLNNLATLNSINNFFNIEVIIEVSGATSTNVGYAVTNYISGVPASGTNSDYGNTKTLTSGTNIVTFDSLQPTTSLERSWGVRIVPNGASRTYTIKSFRVYQNAYVLFDDNQVFQIYTPRINQTDELFYEFGETYAINNAKTGSRSLEKNTFAAEDYYTKVGDSWIFENRFRNGTTSNFNHYFAKGPIVNNTEVVADNFGKINADIQLERQRFESSIRFSNALVDESNINGLSTFDAFDQKVLATELGEIKKLQVAGDVQQEGSVLLSIHEEDIVTIYVGKTEYFDNSGQSTVATSDAFLGTTRVLKGGFGTLNPESIVQHESKVFGFDATKGVAWRYASNGIYPISNYKMKSLFHTLGKSVQEVIGTTDGYVYGAFDVFHEEFLLTFNTGDSLFTGGKTICWSEQRERFTTYFSFEPEYYAKLNNSLISFKDGDLYLHNSGGDSEYNVFHDESRADSSIETVSNKNPSLVKLWEDNSVEANNIWVMSAAVNERSQSTGNIEDDYEDREGVFYASILRDTNTPNVTTPILRGDEMRSEYLKSLWVYTGTTRTALRFVNIGYFTSSGHDNVR